MVSWRRATTLDVGNFVLLAEEIGLISMLFRLSVLWDNYTPLGVVFKIKKFKCSGLKITLEHCPNGGLLGASSSLWRIWGSVHCLCLNGLFTTTSSACISCKIDWSSVWFFASQQDSALKLFLNTAKWIYINYCVKSKEMLLCYF